MADPDAPQWYLDGQFSSDGGIHQVDYNPPPTVKKFHRSGAKVRGIMGPFGSAKSTGCCFEIFRRSQEQEPDKSGIRKTRWAVVRNTYPELETTTVKTWLEWFPEDVFGVFRWKPPYRHVLEFNDVQAEVWFFALDRVDDVRKLLSLELTGVFVNEAREIPIEIVRAALDRTGRFPSQKNRPKGINKDNWPTWYGLIMDTNPPDEDHWWPIMAGDSPFPEDWQSVHGIWEFFRQPPAAFEVTGADGKISWELNPEAENLENLPTDYYHTLISGKPNHYVRIYVGCKYGTLQEGKLVYPDYRDEIHYAGEELKFIPGRYIHVGIDYGRTPAACFSQKDALGRWADLHELVTFDTGAEMFALLLVAEIADAFPGVPMSMFRFWGDPSGEYKLQGSDNTFASILKTNGIPVRPAPVANENWEGRVSSGSAPLRRYISGRPGYRLSSSCPYLRKGFNGKFFYPKVGSRVNKVRYADMPEKNEYSHVHDARQYGYAGGGEFTMLKRGHPGSDNKAPKPHKARINIQLFGKKKYREKA